MKIRIIRGTVANKVAVVPGEIVEVNDIEARDLIRMGKAAEAPEPAVIEEATSKVAPEKATTRTIKRNIEK